ncbi:MAG: heavy metal translocating P-type ATPase [Halobacteriota archaeon]
MTTDRDHERCTLCDLPAVRGDVVDTEGNRFCCRGCRQVYDALPALNDVDRADVRERVGRVSTAGDSKSTAGDRQAESRPRESIGDPEAAGDGSTPPDAHDRTFLQVRGMHCITCELFVESVAAGIDGVTDARASYVTETARIEYDPDETSPTELCDAVSGFGYDAFHREDAFESRQADHMATIRVAVGVLLGMAVMLQYVTIIYPTYFGGLVYDDRTAAFLAESMAHTSGTYFFIIIGVLTTIVLLVTGRPIVRRAAVAVRTRSPNTDLLVALAAVSAYLYSTLAIAFVENPHVYYDVTVAILVIVTVGDYHKTTIKRRATDRLADLTSVQVDEAWRVDDEGRATKVDIESLEAGDRVRVREGERVPIDGELLEGNGTVDESVVTGESMPIAKRVGDRVVGGSVLTNGPVLVAVSEGATSSLDRIADLVWDLQSSTHGIQGLAHRLATIFVPLVLAIAVVVTAVHLGLGSGVVGALLVGLTVLIVSCPCALGLATPLAIAAGIRDALERQIVIFDETVFERLRAADTVVFDKTGTLTTGEMTVLDDDLPEDLRRDAAILERGSAHPIGMAIAGLVDARVRSDGGVIDPAAGAANEDAGGATRSGADRSDRVESFQSHDRGVTGVVGSREIAIGHPALFDELGWAVPDGVRDDIATARTDGRVAVVVGRDGVARGHVVIGDELRPEWAETVSSLADRGVEVVVLTGDDRRSAVAFDAHDAVDRVFAGVPPEGKKATVERLSESGTTVMVGDGTNDAPALAAADLGIALGGGTAMAADAADVAIVDDDLRSVETIFDVSASAGTRIKQNIGWAFCYNAIAIPLAVTGLLNPLFAALAMGTSSLLVVSNSARSLVDDE